MKNKNKKAVAILFIVFFSTFIITYARYQSSWTGSGNATIALPVVDYIPTEPLTLPIDDLEPGSVKEYYFDVINYKNSQRTKVDMIYDVVIKTGGNLPLEFELYKNNGSINLLDNNQESKGHTLTHLNNQTDTYKLVIKWNIVNNDYRYQDEIDYLKININNKQITKQEVEALIATNVLAELSEYQPAEYLNGAAWNNGVMQLNGINQGVETIDNASYTNGITMEVKFKTFGSVAIQNIMMKRANEGNGYFMYIDINGRLMIDIGGSTNRWNTNFIVPLNVEQHIIYTWNDAEKGKLYINGVLVAKSTIGNQTLLNNSGNIMRIGYDAASIYGIGNYYPFNGEFKVARAYNRALTSEEVGLLFNNAK